MKPPSENQIAQVIEVLGLETCNRDMVVAALQAKNNDIGLVLEEYFSNSDEFRHKYAWDESAFAANKSGDVDYNIAAFSVESFDENQPGNGGDVTRSTTFFAPSRPPSRINNRSPLGAPNTKEQEDADLQRALRESMAATPQPLPQPQETGVTTQRDTSEVAFLPATRSIYDPDRWSMVQAWRNRIDVEPSARRRAPEAPAFLRWRTENELDRHRLGALLTIYHDIPLARNTLLRCRDPATPPPPHDYGHDADWWKGKPILPSDPLLSADQPELPLPAPLEPQWLHELQRLMAFLDLTDRSYGTADALASTQVPGLPTGTDPESDFFNVLQHYQGDGSNVSPFFTVDKRLALADDGPSASETLSTSSWGLLEICMPEDESVQTLNQLLDTRFLVNPGKEPLDQASFSVLQTPADVLTLRFAAELPRAVNIPPVLYVDRYLEHNADVMRQVQRDAYTTCASLTKTDKEEKRIATWHCPVDSKTYDWCNVARQAIDMLHARIRGIENDALWCKFVEDYKTDPCARFIPSPRVDPRPAMTEKHHQDCAHWRAVIERIEGDRNRVARQLKMLAQERAACQELRTTLSQVLTGPSDDPERAASHTYSLRGVVDSHDTVYVCRRVSSKSTDADGVSETYCDGWWKLSYIADDLDPIKAVVTSFDVLIKEACGPGCKPILVYASTAAMEEVLQPLSDALRSFIEADNYLFARELADEGPRDKKRGPYPSPSSPSKRLNRSASVDSLATNRASVGDIDDLNDAGAPLDGEYYLSDTFPGKMGIEMRDLTTRTAPPTDDDELPPYSEVDPHAPAVGPD